MEKNIYNHLADDISKELFEYRLMYYLSEGDSQFYKKMACTNPQIKEMFVRMKMDKKGIAVYGAGYRGQQLVRLYPEFNWKYYIDKDITKKTQNDIPIISIEEMLDVYNNELVIISSRLNYDEMYEELVKRNIPVDNIINYGCIVDGLFRNQYFDLKELHLCEETFVDVGCWDGLSTKLISEKAGVNIKKSYCFEPDSKQMLKCKSTLSDKSFEIEYIDKGVWSKSGNVRFTVNGSMFTESENGEMLVSVTTLDEVINGSPVTYIKMDIEGSEREALLGCENTIRTQHPKLAICIYHKLEDVLGIPSLILDYYNGYKLFIRHYSPFDVETVLYAIPE